MFFFRTTSRTITTLAGIAIIIFLVTMIEVKEDYVVGTFHLSEPGLKMHVQKRIWNAGVIAENYRWEGMPDDRYRMVVDHPQSPAALRKLERLLTRVMQQERLPEAALPTHITVVMPGQAGEPDQRYAIEPLWQQADMKLFSETQSMDSGGQYGGGYNYSYNVVHCTYHVPLRVDTASGELPDLSYRQRYVVDDLAADDPRREFFALMQQVNDAMPTQYREYTVETVPAEATALFADVQFEYEGNKGLFWVHADTKTENNNAFTHQYGNSHFFTWCEDQVAQSLPTWLRQVTEYDPLMTGLQGFELDFTQAPLD